MTRILGIIAAAVLSIQLLLFDVHGSRPAPAGANHYEYFEFVRQFGQDSWVANLLDHPRCHVDVGE